MTDKRRSVKELVQDLIQAIANLDNQPRSVSEIATIISSNTIIVENWLNVFDIIQNLPKMQRNTVQEFFKNSVKFEYQPFFYFFVISSERSDLIVNNMKTAVPNMFPDFEFFNQVFLFVKNLKQADFCVIDYFDLTSTSITNPLTIITNENGELNLQKWTLFKILTEQKRFSSFYNQLFVEGNLVRSENIVPLANKIYNLDPEEYNDALYDFMTFNRSLPYIIKLNSSEFFTNQNDVFSYLKFLAKELIELVSTQDYNYVYQWLAVLEIMDNPIANKIQSHIFDLFNIVCDSNIKALDNIFKYSMPNSSIWNILKQHIINIYQNSESSEQKLAKILSLNSQINESQFPVLKILVLVIITDLLIDISNFSPTNYMFSVFEKLKQYNLLRLILRKLLQKYIIRMVRSSNFLHLEAFLDSFQEDLNEYSQILVNDDLVVIHFLIQIFNNKIKIPEKIETNKLIVCKAKTFQRPIISLEDEIDTKLNFLLLENIGLEFIDYLPDIIGLTSIKSIKFQTIIQKIPKILHPLFLLTILRLPEIGDYPKLSRKMVEMLIKVDVRQSKLEYIIKLRLLLIINQLEENEVEISDNVDNYNNNFIQVQKKILTIYDQMKFTNFLNNQYDIEFINLCDKLKFRFSDDLVSILEEIYKSIRFPLSRISINSSDALISLYQRCIPRQGRKPKQKTSYFIDVDPRVKLFDLYQFLHIRRFISDNIGISIIE
jgi:hypothetical protein